MHPSERLKGLDVFVCVADAGSFTAAAERLHLTASAVGKSIARLEERLGRTLFHRTTRRVRISAQGEVAYAWARKILEEIRGRLSQQTRPKAELDYLDRLLKPE